MDIFRLKGKAKPKSSKRNKNGNFGMVFICSRFKKSMKYVLCLHLPDKRSSNPLAMSNNRAYCIYEHLMSQYMNVQGDEIVIPEIASLSLS